MFAPTPYLSWARRFFGRVRFDLATSGISTVSRAELGDPPDAWMDDPGAWTRLREAIARYSGVQPLEVVSTLGTSHALWLAYATLAGPGDDIVVEEPAYEPLLVAARSVGARVVRFAREPREGFAIDPDRISRAITPRTRLVAVTNLHNPSGVRARDEDLRAAARLLDARGGFLLVDEVYAPFDEFVDANGTFRGSARRLGPNVLAVGSLTKCYGLGPHRIGWILAPAEVAAHAEDSITTSCGWLPLSHAHVGVHAFGRLVALADRSRDLLSGKRARVAAWATERGLGWSAPVEGLFGFVTVPGAADLTPAIEAAARDHEVLVAPGAFFGIPGGFRLSWSASSATLEEGLERLSDCLGRWR
jgi:aspartate/methionine/tyrosine aminotransferase